MALEWEQVVVDCTDPSALGRWWTTALGWPAPEVRTTKNRLHMDFRPENRDVEVARLLELGARRLDVGQGDVPWVVLADPEGNEFCVLGERS